MGKIKQYFSMQRVLLLALLFVCLAPLSALAQTIQLTGTVTYDYDFIQHFRIIFQCYFDVLLPVEGNFLGYITHIRDYHSCFGRDCQRKVAVNVGDATITGSFFQDTGTDKRF